MDPDGPGQAAAEREYGKFPLVYTGAQEAGPPPHTVVPGHHGAGHDNGERGQRRGRHSDIRHSGGPGRIRPSLAVAAHHLQPGGRAGDERPDGRGDGQGACRPYPGALWRQVDLALHDAPDRRELDLHYRGVRGGGGLDGAFRDKQIHFGAARRRIRLVSCRQGELQTRRARFPHILPALFHLRRLRITGAPALA